MRCSRHDTEASGICPFCGMAFCPHCTLVHHEARCACSQACLDGLLALDQSATISITKGQKSLKANVLFCLFLGGVFVVIGLLLSLGGSESWGFAAVVVFFGLSFMGGGLIYARALRDNKTKKQSPAVTAT